VLGVATFYSQFRLAPSGRHAVSVCQGTACHVNGAKTVYEAVRSFLGAGENGGTTEDGRFTLGEVACLGCCGLAPVMTVDDRVFGVLTPESAVKILSGDEWT
jgi:NADH-quinone oxidoreductase subunit E